MPGPRTARLYLFSSTRNGAWSIFKQASLYIVFRGISRFPSTRALNCSMEDPAHWVIRFGLSAGAPVALLILTTHRLPLFEPRLSAFERWSLRPGVDDPPVQKPAVVSQYVTTTVRFAPLRSQLSIEA